MSKEKKGKETENQIEEKRSQIKISVRNLVEFIFREGDIDNRHGQSVSPEAMLAGSRMHRRIQKRMGSNYHAEVPLKIAIEEDAQLICNIRKITEHMQANCRQFSQ